MPVDFLITGFSAFHQVDSNPTDILIQQLRALQERGTAHLAEARVIATDVLKVAVGAVSEWQSSHLPKLTAVNPTVLVHFGLDVGGKVFRLEEQAVNEATFRCPDQDGWCPHEEMIDKSDGSLRAELHTSLQLTDLQSE
ncbi:hypothetical protein WJX73_000976 [Symbiochloris irregularis]|uniref:Pyroglutamyl-peptidase I n=1 Tax=Symbiochloris irregularis TaxID=706552 RepID=A0AAW1NZJ5_9CHLO